jgi:segregation and condensation protein A
MIPEADSAESFLKAEHPTIGNVGAPALRLGAYEGPLDLLLELARAQRVDLAKLSVEVLAGQFSEVLDAALARRAVPLSRLAEWLIMAAWLLLLRSRLLLPAEAAESAAARDEAATLRRRLIQREAVQRLANWLERRPRLGRDVFARGSAEPDAHPLPAADITELLRACLRLLALPPRERVYRPSPPALWRVPDALAWLRDRLAGLPAEGVPLAQLLPSQRMVSPVQQRAAIASTLMAGLELSREGALSLEQRQAFGDVRFLAVARQPDLAAPPASDPAPEPAQATDPAPQLRGNRGEKARRSG